MQEVSRLWYSMERTIRDNQIKTQREKNQQKRKKYQTKIKDALALWKEALEVTNKAFTSNEYKRSVELFIDAVGNVELNQYEACFAIEYKRFLKTYRKRDGQPMSPSTQQKHIRHLNVFFHGHLKTN